MKKALLFLMCCAALLLPAGTTVYAQENEAAQGMIVESTQLEREQDPEYPRAVGETDESFEEEISISEKSYGKSNYVSYTDTTYVHNSRFEDSNVVIGIDVSKWQGNIDWASVKKSGVEFAIIRVAYRGAEDGQLYEDPMFRTNIEGALAAGIKVGVYIFSQAINNDEAYLEARYIMDLISGYNITLPVVMDFEYRSGENKGRLYNAQLSVDAATDVCNAFCGTVKAAGYTPMVYMNKNMLEHAVNAGAISNNYDIWLANWTSQTEYQGAYTFWQYSSQGLIEGIWGYVDCDFWYTDIMSLSANGRTATRVGGDTRYDTAIAAARQMNTGSYDNAVLVCGENYPDALSGVPLAAEYDAPILLIGSSDSENNKTYNYLNSNVNRDGTIFVLGNQAALPDSVISRLQTYGFQNIVRLGGADRYETNMAVINYMTIEEGSDIIIATGTNYADGLSASSIAGKENIPIFLANSWLSQEELNKILEIKPEHIYIIGGTNAVSNGVEEQLTAIGRSGVVRFSGVDRFETSLLVANYFFQTSTYAVAAYGYNYPDALAGSVMAGYYDAPVLLIDANHTIGARDYLNGNGRSITTVWVMGMKQVISDGTVYSTIN